MVALVANDERDGPRRAQELSSWRVDGRVDSVGAVYCQLAGVMVAGERRNCLFGLDRVFPSSAAKYTFQLGSTF